MTQRIVSLREIRLGCITNCLTDNSRKSSYFSQTNSIFFSKAKYVKKVNVSFTVYSVKQHDTVEYLACQLDSKLSGEALASKILQKVNPKLKFLYRKNRYLTSMLGRLIQRANSATFRLIMFLVSWFKETLKNQNSKSSQQIYSFLLKFTSKISYQSIAF